MLWAIASESIRICWSVRWIVSAGCWLPGLVFCPMSSAAISACIVLLMGTEGYVARMSSIAAESVVCAGEWEGI